MSSWLLRPVEPRAVGGFANMKKMDRAVAEAPAAPSPTLQMEAGDISFDAVEAERVQAGLVHTGYNLAYEVPGRSEIPSDNSEHRVGLRQDTLAGKVDYRAVPALNAAAFMVAHAESPKGYPLLAGPVRVFAGSAYLGSYPLDEKGPGSEVTIPFGIDNRVSVDRTPLPQDRGKSGIFGREKRISYGYRTTIENLRDKVVRVVLEDRIPVSEDERIEVEMGEGTTPGSTEVKDRPGILEWSLELGPKEKRDVVLEYTIRFPKDLIVPGTD